MYHGIVQYDGILKTYTLEYNRLYGKKIQCTYFETAVYEKDERFVNFERESQFERDIERETESYGQKDKEINVVREIERYRQRVLERYRKRDREILIESFRDIKKERYGQKVKERYVQRV